MYKTKRFVSLSAAIMLLGISLIPVLMNHDASAAQITQRSLTLEPGATDGGSLPGGVVKHLFDFSVTGGSSVGSIQFLYCTTAASVPGGTQCVTPTGLLTTSATLLTQSGATGFSLVNTTNGAPYLTRTASNIAGTGQIALSYELGTVTNPSAVNTTFFVRISTFPTTDASGPATDAGTVAASTANAIVLTGTMPESLVFCTGAIISTTSGVPDCTTATSGNISFNQLFSPTSTAFATSQMAASTNAGSGYAITVAGKTMTSGSNSITAMTTTDTSKFGVSQFGLNLVLNDGTAYTNAPNITNMAPFSEANSANITPASGTGNFNGEALAGFATPGSFTFNDTANNAVANSTSKATDSQIYTASYIVNVPGSQPAGTYTTTLTYICTPTF